MDNELIKLTEDDYEIIMEDGISAVAVNSSQFNQVFVQFQKTPLKFIKQRPGRGKSGTTCRTCGGAKTINHIPCKTCNGVGVAVDYVEGWYIKQILNVATKFKWSSYIDEMRETGNQVIVRDDIV